MNYYQKQQALKERNKSFREKLQAAFRGLRKQGYVCRSNYLCCQGCGCSALAQEYGEDCKKWVFYHKQSGERLREGNGIRLTWDGNGWEIAYALREQGLEVDWDGTDERTIGVDLPFAEDAANAA